MQTKCFAMHFPVAKGQRLPCLIRQLLALGRRPHRPLSGDALRSRLVVVVWAPNDWLRIHLADKLHETASISDALSTHPARAGDFRTQAFGCRNVPYRLLAATAAAACSMTRIAAIMGHAPRLTRRTPTRARSGISGTPCTTMMLTGRGVR